MGRRVVLPPENADGSESHDGPCGPSARRPDVRLRMRPTDSALSAAVWEPLLQPRVSGEAFRDWGEGSVKPTALAVQRAEVLVIPGTVTPIGLVLPEGPPHETCEA